MQPLRPPSRHSASGFFFCEKELLSLARASWSRDELRVYLLMCRGCKTTNEGACFGANGAKDRLGLSSESFRRALHSLFERGVLVDTGRTSGFHQVTGFVPLCGVDVGGAGPGAGALAHSYGFLAAHTDLIKMPWALVDNGRLLTEPSLRVLASADGILFTVMAYGETDSDGRVSPEALESAVAPECYGLAGYQDAIQSGLLTEVGRDPRRRAICRLALPMGT